MKDGERHNAETLTLRATYGTAVAPFHAFLSLFFYNAHFELSFETNVALVFKTSVCGWAGSYEKGFRGSEKPEEIYLPLTY